MFTRRGITGIVIGVLLWILARVIGATEFYLLGTASIVLAAVCLLYVHLRRFDIRLARVAIPQRAHVGEPITIYLRLENKSRVPSPPLVIRDNVAEWGQARHLVEPIPGKSLYEVHYRVPTPRRGRLALGPAELAAIDPFGFAVRSRYVPERTSLLVLPKILPVVAPPIPGRSEITGRLQRVTAGAEDDFALRNYNVGDDARMIHWRSTARRGTLLVREPLNTTPGSGTIVLDTSNVANATAFEAMVSMTASLLVAMEAEHIPFQLAFTDGYRSKVSTTHEELVALLDILAECRITKNPPLLTHELRSISSVVFITAALDSLIENKASMFAKTRHESSRIVLSFGDLTRGLKGVTCFSANADTFVSRWNASVSNQGKGRAR